MILPTWRKEELSNKCFLIYEFAKENKIKTIQDFLKKYNIIIEETDSISEELLKKTKYFAHKLLNHTQPSDNAETEATYFSKKLIRYFEIQNPKKKIEWEIESLSI